MLETSKPAPKKLGCEHCTIPCCAEMTLQALETAQLHQYSYSAFITIIWSFRSISDVSALCGTSIVQFFTLFKSFESPALYFFAACTQPREFSHLSLLHMASSCDHTTWSSQ